MFDEILKRIAQVEDVANRALLQPRSEWTGGVARANVADLPTFGQVGQLYYARDGRKGGEGAGNGTGIPVFWDAVQNAWLTFYDNTPVQA